MFLISVPSSDNLAEGSPATINGIAVTIRRDGDHLVYHDGERLNRCLILSESPVDRLPMPDGSVARGIFFACASHGEDPRECVILA